MRNAARRAAAPFAAFADVCGLNDS